MRTTTNRETTGCGPRRGRCRPAGLYSTQRRPYSTISATSSATRPGDRTTNIANEFVSTNGRTFERPPDSWTITTWKDTEHFFAGSPQSLTADYIHEGVTGCSGHIDEPYLSAIPRPDLLLPAYYSGRNLAESYYVAMPGLSWQNIVVGDPLCKIGRP